MSPYITNLFIYLFGMFVLHMLKIGSEERTSKSISCPILSTCIIIGWICLALSSMLDGTHFYTIILVVLGTLSIRDIVKDWRSCKY